MSSTSSIEQAIQLNGRISDSTLDRPAPDRDLLQNKYWSLVSESLRDTDEEFVKGLRCQLGGEQERGRAAVLYLSNHGPAKVKIFQNSAELRSYLDEIVKEDSSEGIYHSRSQSASLNVISSI